MQFIKSPGTSLHRAAGTLVVLLCLLLPAAEVYSADSSLSIPPYGYAGVFLSTGLELHSAEFSELPGTFSCSPVFGNTTGSGWSCGLSWENHCRWSDIPFASSLENYCQPLLITGRLRLHSASADFRAAESTRVRAGTSEQNGVFEHILNTRLSSLNLDLMVGQSDVWRQLSVHTGLSIGFIAGSTYNMLEHIVEPINSGVFVENNRRVRNEQSGSIQDLNSLSLGFLVAAGWKLPLDVGQHFFARPEISALLPLTSPVAGITWSTVSLHVGVSLCMEIPSFVSSNPLPTVPPELLSPTENPVQPTIVAALKLIPTPEALHYISLDIFRKDEKGLEFPADTIYLQQYSESIVHPLLNYIFFDESSAEIPERYVAISSDSTQYFSTRNLNDKGQLETYHELLNIVGKRMNENPGSSITLTGCNVGNVVEGGKIELSRKRAEAVRDYLVKTWGIGESRIQVIARNRPVKPSYFGNKDGDEENRRVEISSDDTRILEPVFSTDTLRTPIPEILYLRPGATVNSNIVSWNIQYKVNDDLTSDIARQGALTDNVELPLSKFFTRLNENDSTLKFIFTSLDESGKLLSAKPKELHLVRAAPTIALPWYNSNKIVEKFSLILFDYDDASFNQDHESTLKLVRASITADAVVYVTGYTDRMGDDDYNQKLSEKRARAVAEALGVQNRGNIVGLGESVVLYSNHLPEGRFYSRTIDIRVVRNKN